MITESQRRKLDRLLAKAEKDTEVLAVILYGSRISGKKEETPDSDLDICLVPYPTENDKREMTRKRLDYLSTIDPEDIDLQVFRQLSIYIRQRVLGEGRVEYCDNSRKLYDLAYITIQGYEDFKPRLREYLEGVENG